MLKNKDLENMCWVCYTLIDPSKPSKPYEKEETGFKGKELDLGEKELKNEPYLIYLLYRLVFGLKYSRNYIINCMNVY